ncbi:MAG: NF038122 family metalloprotease [Acetobacteraceae bacterium]|nr:NF038122 family metalloprotease [Acetobacteraceae bacterium]
MPHFSRRPGRRAALLTASVIAGTALAAPAPASANLMFNLSYLAGTPAAAQNAFAAAASAWSAMLADNVTVNLTVGTAALGPNILASTGAVDVTTSYSTFRAALAADATSSNDATAVASLPAGSSLHVLINHTLQNAGNSYVDSTGANTATIRLSNANARALGLPVTTSNLGGNCIGTCDGYIAFSTGFGFDTDPSDGIAAGQFDFVGIAIHEIGHALGFISGVDVLDTNANSFGDNAFTYISPLDMFRCSAASAAQNAIDWTAGSDPKSFSLNNCTTTLASFATGMNFGDGRQASHWKDNLGLGIMDPTSAPGEALAISQLDLTAMDVIGWNLAGTTDVPAPASALVFVFGLAGLGWARRMGGTA